MENDFIVIWTVNDVTGKDPTKPVNGNLRGLFRWYAPTQEAVKNTTWVFQGDIIDGLVCTWWKKITFVGQKNTILQHNSKLISLLRIKTVIYFYVLSEYTLWHACNFDMATDKQGQFWQFDLPQFAKLATLLLPWKSGTNFALIMYTVICSKDIGLNWVVFSTQEVLL